MPVTIEGTEIPLNMGTGQISGTASQKDNSVEIFVKENGVWVSKGTLPVNNGEWGGNINFGMLDGTHEVKAVGSPSGELTIQDVKFVSN